MTTTTELIQALEAAALAATTGDWTADGNFGFSVQCYRTGLDRLLATVNGPNAENDLAFITQAYPAAILSILAERKSDKALIAEQVERIAKLERALDLARNSNSVSLIRAELQACTLTVKLPDYSEFAIVHFTGCSDDYAKGWVDGRNTVNKAYSTACATAGITLVVGGE